MLKYNDPFELSIINYKGLNVLDHTFFRFQKNMHKMKKN